MEPRRALPLSWLVALVATVGMLATVLVFTEDLAVIDARLAGGAAGIRTASSLTAEASAAAGDLAPAASSLEAGIPEAEAVGGLLERSIDALGRMQTDVERLDAILGSVNAPATDAVASVGGAQRSAASAGSATARAADSLVEVRDRLHALIPLFDETAVRAARIESRLRVLRLGA